MGLRGFVLEGLTEASWDLDREPEQDRLPEVEEGDGGNAVESLPCQVSNIWKSPGCVHKEWDCVFQGICKVSSTKERFTLRASMKTPSAKPKDNFQFK